MDERRRWRPVGVAVVLTVLLAGCGDDSGSDDASVDPAEWSRRVCDGLVSVGEERADDLTAAFAAVPSDLGSEAELGAAVSATATAYEQAALLAGDYLEVIAAAGAPDVTEGRAYVAGVLKQLETAEDSALDAVDRLEDLGPAPTLDEYQIVAARLSDLTAAQQVFVLDIGSDGPVGLAAAYEAEPACGRADEVFSGFG